MRVIFTVNRPAWTKSPGFGSGCPCASTDLRLPASRRKAPTRASTPTHRHRLFMVASGQLSDTGPKPTHLARSLSLNHNGGRDGHHRLALVRPRAGISILPGKWIRRPRGILLQGTDEGLGGRRHPPVG